MANSTALVFPGMGPSAFADVGRFMVVNPYARKLVAVADEVLGYSLVDTFREAEGDYSEAAQVAFLVNCLACAQWAVDQLDIEPEVCAGPSFGEKAAVAFAGGLPVDEAIRMTAELARLLEDWFSREHRDIVTLSFVRVREEQLREILAELDERGEWHEISSYVDEDFVMLSLGEERVEWLSGRLRAVGGMPLYTMRPPMHCAAFGGLRDRAEAEVLSTLTFTDPGCRSSPTRTAPCCTPPRAAHDAARQLRTPHELAECRRRVEGLRCRAGLRRRSGQPVRPGRRDHGQLRGPGRQPRLAMTPRRRSGAA
ncbi:ACP S-malonyltransferase [Streptomyces sp. M19]